MTHVSCWCIRGTLDLSMVSGPTVSVAGVEGKLSLSALDSSNQRLGGSQSPLTSPAAAPSSQPGAVSPHRGHQSVSEGVSDCPEKEGALLRASSGKGLE